MIIKPPDSVYSKETGITDDRIHVVVGSGPRAGSIKSIPYSRQFATRGWFVQSNDPDGYNIDLTRKLKMQGYQFLRDMYEAEGNLDGYEVYKDYCVAGRQGRVDITAPGCTVTPGFPDELLPKAVVNMAKSRGPLGGKWKPPTKAQPQTQSAAKK